MRLRAPVAAVAGCILCVAWFGMHLLNAGGWQFQLITFVVVSPFLSVLLVVLAWRARWAARCAGLHGAARHLALGAAGWAVMTISWLLSLGYLVRDGTGSYPWRHPLVGLCDLVVTVLIIAALLSTPVRTRWSASRLRLGLDMATVLLAGLTFLWHLVVQPAIAGPIPVPPALLLATGAGVLLALFAAARLVVAGIAEISPRAMVLAGGAGVAQMIFDVLQRIPPGSAHAHLLLAARPVFAGLLVMTYVEHLKSIARGGPTSTRRESRTFSILPYLAVAATDVLLIHAMIDGRGSNRWGVLGGAIALTALVMARQIVGLRDNDRLVRRVDAGMQALRAALAREQLLGDVGTELLRTTDADRVHELAAETAVRLLAGCPQARCVVLAADPQVPGGWQVVRAAGVGAESLRGVRLSSGDLPEPVMAELAAGRVVALPGLGPATAARYGTTPDRPLVVHPLYSGDRFFGMLCVATAVEMPDDVVKSLHALRTQVSLALGNAALTRELTTQATHDALTGLGNRALLWERLAGALARSRRSHTQVGVLLLDLNGFKLVNDTYGHGVGDQLLKVVAERLRGCVRVGDTVARLGGDEFVVVAEDLTVPDGERMIAERIVAALHEPVTVDGHTLCTPASVGVALAGPDCGPDDVLRAADTAMYVAKRRGGGRYHVQAMDSESQAASA